MEPIYDQVRAAIQASGKTRYRIANDLGIDESALSLFMNGKRGLSVERLELIAEYLGFRLVLKPARRRR